MVRVDRGEVVIVDVNKYRLENEDELEILAIDNCAVCKAQVKRLEEMRRRRDGKAVEAALARLTAVARTGQCNLLEAAVEAARACASVGEISDAMRRVYGDHSAVPEVVGDIYSPAYEGDRRRLQPDRPDACSAAELGPGDIRLEDRTGRSRRQNYDHSSSGRA